MSLIDAFFESVGCNILLNYLIVNIDVALSVASQDVKAFEGGEEGSHEDKEEVGH